MLKRFKKKNKIGLSLRGGGAKTIGYLGAVKAFEEEGVEFDGFIGSSGGAALAVYLGMGISYDEIISIYKDFTSKVYTGVHSLTELNLMDTQKVYNYTHKFVGDISFEELPKTVLLQTVNLNTKKLEVFSSGKVIDAYLASTAAPLIRHSYKINNVEYTDGDLMGGYGVKDLNEAGCNKVLAFQASSKENKTNGPIGMLSEALTLSIKQMLLLDAQINPPDYILGGVGKGFGLLEFDKAEEIFEQGYEIAKQKLGDVRNSLM